MNKKTILLFPLMILFTHIKSGDLDFKKDDLHEIVDSIQDTRSILDIIDFIKNLLNHKDDILDVFNAIELLKKEVQELKEQLGIKNK